MKIEISNLTALVKGHELNPYQRALALREWEKLIAHVPTTMESNEHITKSIMHLKEFHDLHNRCARRAKGSELDFITRIKRDGSGVIGAAHIPEIIEGAQKDEFILHRLSITEDTWIAIGFNSFVVKIKNKTNDNIF